MNPYLSWAIVLLVAGGLGLYYRDGSTTKGRPAPSKTIPEKSENSIIAHKKPKRKQKKSPDVSSGTGTPTPTLKVDTEAPKQGNLPDVAAQDEVDNKEFAKQFAKVKGGTPLSSTGKTSKKEQAAANKAPSTSGSEALGSHVSARASSTDGADADDDLSPVESPVEPFARASGDVSDMLEAPAPGASVLRLTGSVQNEQAKKKKKQESFKPVETKKQRQQRLKNESKRALVEEAEKQRRALLEKQLHSARESERREAAKTKSAPPKNAWTVGNDTAQRATNGVSKAPATASSSSGGLLDTFDSTPKPAARQPVKSENIKPTNRSQQEGSWAKDLPSEEEQMRLLNNINSESEWTTVSSKKEKKRKGNKADGSVSEASSSDMQVAKQPDVSSPQIITPTPVTIQETPSINGKGGHPLDSDWTA